MIDVRFTCQPGCTNCCNMEGFVYLSEDDLVEKLRMLMPASTVVAGMFVNSPLEGGQLTGLLSRRTQWWLTFS